MSYQFLSISSPHSHSTVYLQSDAVPTGLTQLIETRNQEIASTSPQGNRFEYLELQAEAHHYHLLSAIKVENNNTLIIHHVALTEDEANYIRNLEQRITPAGIILSLQQADFWLTSSTNTPEPLSQIPNLSTLPQVEAATQDTWKRLSGHKSNACAFFTPPYDAHCLFSISPTLSLHDVLMLIHESTWLMPSKGWGKAFAAVNDTGILNFSKTQLIVTHQGSQAENCVRTSSLAPILVLSSDLSLDGATYSAPLSSAVHYKTKENDSIIDHGDEPYKYIEGADEDVYDLPNPRLRHFCMKTGAILVLSALLIGGSIYAYNKYSEQHTQESPALTARQQLADILKKQQPTRQDFIKLKATTAHDIELQESLNKLIYGPDRIGGHPENLLYLIRQAKLHKLPGKQILCYYLESATSTYTTSDWVEQNTQPEVLRVWNTLFREYPAAVSTLLHHHALQPYMQPIIESPIRNRKR